MNFEIVKTETKNGERWHARIRGDNGILFWTKDCKTKQEAKDACELVQSGAASAPIPEKSIKESDGSPVV